VDERETTRNVLPRLASKKEYFEFLDGYAVERAEELGERHVKRGLVKSYMLETVRRGADRPSMETILDGLPVHYDRIDDATFLLGPRDGSEIWGLLEVLEERHPVIYTLLGVQESDSWIRGLVERSRWLDRLWLSARVFLELWDVVVKTTAPGRFTRMTFEHESVFEAELQTDRSDSGTEEDEEAQEELEDQLLDSDAEALRPERRASRFAITERIQTIRDKLRDLQAIYAPLYSITQLRIPSPSRGGHDFYFDGKVTNRSDSFVDHRQQLDFVIKTYRSATERAEEVSWLSMERLGDDPRLGLKVRGTPVYLRFSQPLDIETFDHWIDATFRRKTNRFRLWGNPLSMGKGKVHVYGIDRHLWQPIYLELTTRHVLAFLPRGTCGNTIHRLVTNIQRFLDPAVQAWVGDTPFDEIIREAIGGK
jgi:hypothetical protein